jgi:succinoglycan biosynthesis protein ExoO
MEDQLVSVIIPTYNVEKYIKKCIDSVLAQTYPYFEIIVVDDCSNDNTVRIIKSYTDPRIKLLVNKENKGPAFSRNRAISIAQGKWIAFLDGDDWWSPNRLEYLLDIALKKEADIVFDDIYMINDGDKEPYGTQLISKKILIKSAKELGISDIINHDLGMQPIIRKSFIERHKIFFDESLKYGEDFMFILNLMVGGAKTIVYPTPMYFYRLRSNSLMRNREELLKVTINSTKKILSDPCLCEDVKKALIKRLERLHLSLEILYLKNEYISKNYIKFFKRVVTNPRLFLHLLKKFKFLL